MRFYKIRNRSRPELYRYGGIAPRWSKSGKTWDTLAKLRSIITMILNSSHREELAEWEIVEFEVKEIAAKHPNDVIDPKKLVQILSK